MTTPTKEPTKAAVHARTWREKHPDRYRTTLQKQAARRRAMARLANEYPDTFDAFLAEELLKS